MVYLDEIRIYDEGLKAISPFNKSSASAIHLFLRLIKGKLVTNNVRIINIRFENTDEKHLRYDITAGFAWVWYDVNKLPLPEEVSAYDIPKLTIDTIYAILCNLCEQEGWNVNVVMDVYNQCMELKIKNEWWFKDKLLAAPGKQFYAGLYHIYDAEKYEIQIVLFDKTKKELIRHPIYRSGFELFVIDKISWQNQDTISYQFKGPKKLFVYTVAQLLNSEVEKIPEKINQLFK